MSAPAAVQPLLTPAPKSGVAVSIRNLCLEYRLVHERQVSLKEAVIRFLRGSAFRKGLVERFRALDNLSFTVQRGEALGVIGHNGSGKTSLLRLLAGVLSPTSGAVDVQGRITTLIDLGAGFNQELSGEENVYLCGALYGFSRAAMRARFDRIVKFAELERFIEVPVKNYSAGMSARLGFAIATDVDPEVLLVDEVLGVGDEAFQAKCRERMNLFKSQGRTIILVSHDLNAIGTFCDRALLLERGKLVAEGRPQEVIETYRKRASAGS
ncbi:MAG TPA: ABC transporter ATP-binding protein [bacterium]|nr:ABC transporter ATP-binding protein [bacterium]